MSRVYFHSPSGEAELWGGERAWLGSLCSRIAIGALDLRYNAQSLRELVAPGHWLASAHYAGDGPQFADSLALALGGLDEPLAWHGKPIEGFSLILNTAARLGGDAVKLAARIHGQCEIHCYAEGADRAWLAGIIDEGLLGEAGYDFAEYEGLLEAMVDEFNEDAVDLARQVIRDRGLRANPPDAREDRAKCPSR